MFFSMPAKNWSAWRTPWKTCQSSRENLQNSSAKTPSHSGLRSASRLSSSSSTTSRKLWLITTRGRNRKRLQSRGDSRERRSRPREDQDHSKVRDGKIKFQLRVQSCSPPQSPWELVRPRRLTPARYLLIHTNHHHHHNSTLLKSISPLHEHQYLTLNNQRDKLYEFFK